MKSSFSVTSVPTFFKDFIETTNNRSQFKLSNVTFLLGDKCGFKTLHYAVKYKQLAEFILKTIFSKVFSLLRTSIRFYVVEKL